MTEENRNKRRDKKRFKKKHGMQGPTGKIMFVIQQQIIKGAKDAKAKITNKKMDFNDRVP